MTTTASPYQYCLGDGSVVYLIHVRRDAVVSVQALVESIEGLAIIRTLLPDQGLLCIVTTESRADECREMLQDIEEMVFSVPAVRRNAFSDQENSLCSLGERRACVLLKLDEIREHIELPSGHWLSGPPTAWNREELLGLRVHS